MRNLILSYLFSIRHPFDFASYVGGNDLIEESKKREWVSWGIRPLNITEAIVLSWIFEIFSSIFILVIFGFKDFFVSVHPMLEIKIPSNILVITIGLSLAFFPFKVVFLMGGWKWFMRVFMELYLDEDEIDEHLENIFSHSLSSYVVVAIPFVGSFFQVLLWGFYLFAGMKNTYSLSSSQCMLILSLMVIFLFLLVFSCFLSVILLFI